MRKKIYDFIEVEENESLASKAYDIFMMIVIILSLVPVAAKDQGTVIHVIDKITVAVFIVDYGLRMLTADYKLSKKGISFFIYPLTPMAIVDLISILPSLTALNGVFRTLKVLRLFRTFRVFRAIKLFRYSKNIERIVRVLKRQSAALSAVCVLAIGYVLVSALVIISVEPQTFDTYFDAIYWAVVSLSTVGYGDLYPVSTLGKIVTMVSAIFGIAIVALPAGIITAGYMEEIEKEKKQQEEE